MGVGPALRIEPGVRLCIGGGWARGGVARMAKTFGQMVEEARAHVPAVSPAEAQRRVKENPHTLLIDVQDSKDVQACGLIPGAVPISLGMLAIRADQELPVAYRDARLQDRARPVIVTCGAGGQGALGAYQLQQMGFTDVAFIDGGMAAWKDAGLPTEPFQG